MILMKISAAKVSASPAPPEYLEGRTPKEKRPFLFQKEIHPRQIRNARSIFLSGLPPSPRGGQGEPRAYDSGQSNHARGACEVSQGYAGNASELFDTMTTSTKTSSHARACELVFVLVEMGGIGQE